MALQLGALRAALIDAGASVEKADKAAEEVAGWRRKVAGTEKCLPVATLLVGANIALTLMSLAITFAISVRLSDIAAKLSDIGGQLAQVAARLH